MKTLSELARDFEILRDGAHSFSKKDSSTPSYWQAASVAYGYCAKMLRQWIADDAAQELLEEFARPKQEAVDVVSYVPRVVD